MKDIFREIDPWKNNIIKNIQPEPTTNGKLNGGGSRIWPYDSYIPEIDKNPEKYRVKAIRGIIETDDPTQNPDYRVIMRWMSDPEVARHLRAPIDPIGIDDYELVPEALRELGRYYHNKNRRDKNGAIIQDKNAPAKITPLIAVNGLDEAVATLVVRWKGDVFAALAAKPGDKQIRTAGIENIIVEPKLQHSHIGTQLMVAALEMIFYGYKGYNGESADKSNLWVFTDAIAGDYSVNLNFVQKLGFTVKEGMWKDYAKLRGMPNPGERQGMRFELTKDQWEELKAVDARSENPRLILSQGIVDASSIRIPLL